MYKQWNTEYVDCCGAQRSGTSKSSIAMQYSTCCGLLTRAASQLYDLVIYNPGGIDIMPPGLYIARVTPANPRDHPYPLESLAEITTLSQDI